VKTILFRGYEKLPKRTIGFADIFRYSLACYFKARNMGYDKVYIVFPPLGYESKRWKLSVDDWNWQQTYYLPWKYYPRNKDINDKNWDKVIDTSQPNSLYPGFPGVQHTCRYIYQYFDLYYLKYGKGLPVLYLRREKVLKSYIIFQNRNNKLGVRARDRITSINDINKVYDIVRNHLGDKYEYWKMGEPSDIDSEFDKVIPMMYNNIDEFTRLVRNCSLIVGGHSGPRCFAFHIPDIPIIEVGMVWQANPGDERCWLREVGNNSITKTHPSWVGDRKMTFSVGDKIDKKRIVDFLRKYQL